MASAEPVPDSTAVTVASTHGSTTDKDAEVTAAESGILATAKEKDDEAHVQANTTLHGLRLGAVVAGVCFGSLMISLDVTIIATALPSITSEFGDSTQIAWYPAAFTFATCAITPLAGKMAAVFPINLVYLSFMVIFLAGSILCGWAPTSSAFIAGRAIAGVGSAGVATNGMTILVKVAEPRQKPMFVGLAAGCFAIGLVLAPVIGGLFTSRLTWRWCFWINIPVIAISFAVIFLFFKPPKLPQENLTKRLRKLDLIGCAIFVPTVFMLLYAMQQGGQNDAWNSATVIGLFVGSGVMMLLFVAWERHKGNGAMIPADLVRRRAVFFAVSFAFCHMGSLTVATYYLPQWFQAVIGVDPLQSGIRYLPTVITQIIMTITASSLAVRLKYFNYWFILAPIFLVTASALYMQFTAFSTPPSHWIGFQVIQGVASGWGMQMSSLAVQLELKDSPDLLPVGIALVSFLQYLGASVFQVVAGAVFNSELRQRLTRAGLTPSQTSLLLGAGTKSIRDVVERSFPELLRPVLEAYNSAITRVFFVPLAGGAVGFCLAFGIKWTKIEGVK